MLTASSVTSNRAKMIFNVNPAQLLQNILLKAMIWASAKAWDGWLIHPQFPWSVFRVLRALKSEYYEDSHWAPDFWALAENCFWCARAEGRYVVSMRMPVLAPVTATGSSLQDFVILCSRGRCHCALAQGTKASSRNGVLDSVKGNSS